MKNLLFAAILLTSAGVQADMTCGDLKTYNDSSKEQIDRVWMILEEKKRLYVSTTKRLRPYKHEARKENYEKYAVIYNNLAIVHNRRVELYLAECK